MSARNRNWTFAQFWQGLAQARVSLYLSGFFRSVSQCFRAWRCGLDQSTIERLDVIKNADLSFQTGCDEMLTAYRELREEQEAMKSDPGKQKSVQDIEKMINLLPVDRRIHCWVSEDKQMSPDDGSEQELLLPENADIKKEVSEILDNPNIDAEGLSQYIWRENSSSDKNTAMAQVTKKFAALRQLHQDLVSQVNKKDSHMGQAGSDNTGASFEETAEEKKINLIRTVYARHWAQSHDVMDGFSITNKELVTDPFAIQKALVEGFTHKIQRVNTKMNVNDQNEMTLLYKQLPKPQLKKSLHEYMKKTETEAKVLLERINEVNEHNEKIWDAKLKKQKGGPGDNGEEVLKSRERWEISDSFQKMIANVEKYQQLIQDSFIQNDLSALHALLKKGMKCVQEGNDRDNQHTSHLLDMMEEEEYGLFPTQKSYRNRLEDFVAGPEEGKHTKDAAQERQKYLGEQENRNPNIHGNSKSPGMDI